MTTNAATYRRLSTRLLAYFRPSYPLSAQRSTVESCLIFQGALLFGQYMTPFGWSCLISVMLYELLYILPARHTDTELPEVQAKITALIEASGAKIARNESAGKLKLAYPIKNNRYGQFFIVYFDAPKDVMQKLNETLRLSADLGRYQISKATMPEKETMKILSFDDAKSRAREDRAAAPTYRGAPASADVAPEAAPAVAAKAAASLSMEDLDKKLDQILNEQA